MSDTITARIAAELERAGRPCVTSSFQAECVVLIHLIRATRPHIPVLFIDTFHHFPETLGYRDRLVSEWNLNLITVQSADPARGLWAENTDACCARHKAGPLFQELEAYDAWFTALRREQAASRAQLADVAPFTLPSGKVLRKLSPLATWTARDVRAYAEMHAIPLLPLYTQGYTSIGCAPCTSVPLNPRDARSGRWLGHKLECGIHIEPRHT
ncbi:MAG: phosphoadenylyl-sulfate reductase [Gemmatimonadaceae bacterium]